jgi:hypothetical protein
MKKFVALVMGLCFVVVVMVGCSTGVQNSSVAVSETPQSELHLPTSTPSSTLAPTTAPTPTPTSTPTPESEITTLNDYAFQESFFSYSGSGDDIVSGLSVEHYSFLKVVHLGSGHFAVKAHYDDTYDLLINTTDPYDGGCTLLFPGTEYMLEVKADGKWTVEAFRVGTSSTDTFEGTGDVVTPVCVSTSNIYEIIADGRGHFAVKGYYEDGSYDLLVNTTDPYSGKVMFKNDGGLCFFEITGERDFTITPK